MSETNAGGSDGLAPASPWRRLAAYMIDYFVFIVPLLGLLALGVWALFDFDPPIPTNAWVKHGIMILILTMPIVLYFACCESSPLQGTIGKRLMKVAVVDIHGHRATFKHTALRALLKFLPWEYFHAILWHWDGWPTNPAPATNLQLMIIAIGWLILAWYVVSLFVGSRRTPYDRVAGTVVVTRKQ